MRAQTIFVETLPVIGIVPMTFYLPQSRDYNDLKILIEKHGGLVSDFHECFTYQIAPINEDVQKLQYFWGDVFQGTWIVESIKQGQLLQNDAYFAFQNKEKGSKRVDFVAEKVRYTITEGIKIFEIALANQSTDNAARGSAFWLEIQRKNIVPNRPGESMRNFWKMQLKRGLEDYLSDSVTNETRYCHAFKQIPQVKPQTKTGPYQQAEMRMFEAAAIPTDNLRFQAENSTNKVLRSTAAKRKQDSANDYNSLFSRMEKIKPIAGGNKSAQAAAATGQNSMIDASNVNSNKAAVPVPDELEALMQVGNNNCNGQEDAEMRDEGDDKENVAANLNASSQEYLDMVERKGLVVVNYETHEPVEVCTGQEAFFALLAQDLLTIANINIKKDEKGKSYTLEEMHKMFYEVSCDREKLIRLVKGDKTVPRWQTLEDLALRHSEDTPSFQVVLQQKGREEVNTRKAFLEISQ